MRINWRLFKPHSSKMACMRQIVIFKKINMSVMLYEKKFFNFGIIYDKQISQK